MKRINFVKSIKLLKDDTGNGLLGVKAIGMAELKHLIAPVLVASRNYSDPPEDGIYELDFILDSSDKDYTSLELEVDVVFNIKNLPAWVKGFKVNAKENSDIELI